MTRICLSSLQIRVILFSSVERFQRVLSSQFTFVFQELGQEDDEKYGCYGQSYKIECSQIHAINVKTQFAVWSMARR